MLSNIKESASDTNIVTNGEGDLKSMTTWKVPDLECQSYFNKDSMTITISLSDMEDNYRITIDTKHDKAMCAHMDSKVVTFGQMHN